MGEPPPPNGRYYTGTFCTGHPPMVGTTAIQFSENAFHEFVEEYKNAHGLKERTGPGRAKIYDPRSLRRESPALPIQGCGLARLDTGMLPQRQARTSSRTVGGWWNDPIFAKDAKLPDVVLQPGQKGPVPPCMSNRNMRTSAADVGSYWFDPITSDNDPDLAKKRAANGIRRLLPVESASQFALDDLPTEHRML